MFRGAHKVILFVRLLWTLKSQNISHKNPDHPPLEKILAKCGVTGPNVGMATISQSWRRLPPQPGMLSTGPQTLSFCKLTGCPSRHLSLWPLVRSPWKDLISLAQCGLNIFSEDLTLESIEISQSAPKIQCPHTSGGRNEIISYHVSSSQGINLIPFSVRSQFEPQSPKKIDKWQTALQVLSPFKLAETGAQQGGTKALTSRLN